MANYVGRSKVYLPYYRYKQPMERYPVSVLVGDNLSFPKRRACTEAQALGEGGCTCEIKDCGDEDEPSAAVAP